MASTTSSIRRSVQDGIKIPQKSKPRKDVPPFSSGHDDEVASPTVRKVMPNLATIQMLLHLYVTGDDWELDARASQTEKNAYTYLRTHGMVDSDTSVTKKGRTWIDALKKLPLPVEITTYQIPTYRLNDDSDAN